MYCKTNEGVRPAVVAKGVPTDISRGSRPGACSYCEPEGSEENKLLLTTCCHRQWKHTNTAMKLESEGNHGNTQCVSSNKWSA